MQFTIRDTLLFAVFSVGLLLFSAWSWVLVDPNFTLVAHADWTRFREYAISIGYFQRAWSAGIFVSLVVVLSVCSYLIIRLYRGPILPLAIVAGVLAGLFSYPALSHDVFNYIFDARIFTHYGQNPYLFRALDFPADPMIRFMHWVHRTYPYGPSYLLMSFIPSALGMGKFTATFFLFKLWHTLFFVFTALMLHRISRKAALIFVTSPLILVEGLMNTHNDFIALTLVLGGVIFLIENAHTRVHTQKKHKNWLFAGLLFLTSAGVKFVTAPALLFFVAPHTMVMGWADKKGVHHDIAIRTWKLVLIGIALVLLLLVLRMEMQPWYFLNVFIFLPFIPNKFMHAHIFFSGLLLSYYPYVLGGEWGQGGDVSMKRTIIVTSLVVNVLLILIWQSIFALKNTKHKV